MEGRLARDPAGERGDPFALMRGNYRLCSGWGKQSHTSRQAKGKVVDERQEGDENDFFVTTVKKKAKEMDEKGPELLPGAEGAPAHPDGAQR